MKTAISILSIYIIMLFVSFSAGVHVFESHNDCCRQTEQHACAENHDICCNMFRICSIFNTFIVSEIVQLQVKQKENNSKIVAYRQPIYFSPYIKNVFQPPRI